MTDARRRGLPRRRGSTTPTPPAPRNASSSWPTSTSRGVALATMVEADRAGALAALASELPLRAPGPALSVDDVATLGATTVDRVHRVRLAAGLPADLGDPGHPGLPSTVVDDMVSFEAGAALFGETPTLSFTRVDGSGVARVAEAAVGLFLTERMPDLSSDAHRAGPGPRRRGRHRHLHRRDPAAHDRPAARAHGPRHPALGGRAHARGRRTRRHRRARLRRPGGIDGVGERPHVEGPRPGPGRVRVRGVGHRRRPTAGAS